MSHRDETGSDSRDPLTDKRDKEIGEYWAAQYPYTYADLKKEGALDVALRRAAQTFPLADENGVSWIPPVPASKGGSDLLLMEAILNYWRFSARNIDYSSHDLVVAIEEVTTEISRTRRHDQRWTEVLGAAIENVCPIPEPRIPRKHSRSNAEQASDDLGS